MTALVAGLMLLVGLLLAGPARAQAQGFPEFTGLVTDAANILPADRKAALETKLEALQQHTNHQLVVATVPDLGGTDIADYGYRLGRAWGVGLKGANNGAILLVAPTERKVRIEVGTGLEGIVTDALSSVIIRQDILPRFKTGDMPGGIEAGVDALARQLSLPDDEARAKAAEAATAYDKVHRARGGGGGLPIGIVIWLFIIGFVLLRMMSRGARASRHHGAGGSNLPIWLWAGSEIARGLSDRHGGWGSGSGGGGFGGGDGASDGGGWSGGGFTGGGGGSFDGGGASGSW